jgi:glycosyltransferase involved in cell wall biosynthesis
MTSYLSRISANLKPYLESITYELRILKNDGISFCLQRAKERVRLSRLFLKKATQPMAPPDGAIEIPLVEAPLDAETIFNHSVSVFIPTKNAGAEFVEVLSRLARQKGVQEIEIMVADSGSSDLTPAIAKSYGARVISIDPGTFNHGETRNVGIEIAGGDFLLYLTQDALPIGDDFIRNMLRILIENPDVAAVTCKQVPRSDTDLFCSWSMAKHYDMLNLLDDKIMGAERAEKLSPLQKRSLSSLDNVCTLYRKDVLARYRFRGLQFAEDLDLGVRLIEDGYRIAFLASTAVIHSHNRPPFYSLKRSYIDAKCLNEIFPNTSIAIHSHLSDAIKDIILMFEKINYALQRRNGTAPLKTLDGYFREEGRSDTPLTDDLEFSDFMLRLKTHVGMPKRKNKDIFFEGFSRRLEDFLFYINRNSIVIDEFNKDNFNESVYKIFAGFIGSHIALHCLRVSNSSFIAEQIEKLLANDV